MVFPAPAGPIPASSSLTWTSHLRAELHAATLPGYFIPHPDLRQIRHSLKYQMLRAPGWALGLIGWPDAPRAMRYLDRLAETPVTAAQAHASRHSPP